MSVTGTDRAGNYRTVTFTVTVLPVLTLPALVTMANENAVPLGIIGPPSGSVTYTFTDCNNDPVTGTTTLPPSGEETVDVNVSSLQDGILTATATVTSSAYGTLPAFPATTLKETKPPVITVSPNLTAPATSDLGAVVSYAPATGTSAYGPSYNPVTFTYSQASGTEFAFGTTTVTVTGTDQLGNYATKTFTVTVLPVLTLPAYVNIANESSVPLGILGPPSGSVSYTITDSKGNTVTGTTTLSPTGTATVMVNVTSLQDGTVTATATVNGTLTAVPATAVKLTKPPAAPVEESITAPTNSGSYDVGTNIILVYVAGSSSVTATALLDGTTPVLSGVPINVDTLAPGTHTIVITDTDVAGNTTSITVTFQVHATALGLANAVADGYNRGLVTSAAKSQLDTTLQAVETAIAAANYTTAITDLSTFISQVTADSGSSVAASYATLLESWAADLKSRLP